MFLDNKYTIWYFWIVFVALQRAKNDEYIERHHVIPRWMGGNDRESNIVLLTYREHFIAHWLLTKMVDGSDRRRAWSAVVHMRRSHSGRVVAAWQYVLAKVAGRRAFLGRRHTQKTKELLRKIQTENPSLGHKGHKHTDKAKHQIAATRKERGIGHTNESRAKIGKSLEGNRHLLGHRHSEKTKRQMGQSRLGNQNACGFKHTEQWKRENGARMTRLWAERRAAKKQEQTT